MKDVALFIIACCLSEGVVLGDDLRLLQVNLLYRHGDRSAVSTFPSDPHGERSWPQGFGQLSEIGMQQHYELGQFLRKRYNSLLNTTYIRTEIAVRSTDFDRTLMSAYSNLAGLYSPAGSSFNPSAITWQLVPVHTVPTTDDVLLGLADCQARDDAQAAYITSEEGVEMVAKYKTFTAAVGALTGYANANLSSMRTVRDALFCESQHTYSLPEWISWTNLTKDDQKSAFGVLNDITDLWFTSYYQDAIERRLSAGTLVGQIIKNMESKLASSSSTPNMFVYSAHDTTVAALLSTLGIFNNKSPPYTSTVMIELWGNALNQSFVSIYYKNGTEVLEPMPLRLKGCMDSCPLLDFKTLTASVIPADWKAECNKNNSLSPSQTVIITVVLCVAVTLSLVVVIVCQVLRRRRHKYKRYAPWRAEASATASVSEETEVMLDSSQPLNVRIDETSIHD